MAQRATTFAKKTSRHAEVGVLSRVPGDPSEHMRAVPLDVLPMLAPFKKRGRLSVRIEKLPIQARLSQGRNNGDHSYSLSLDELEDLSYLAPEGTDPRPILSLRVLTLDDGDAATIAVRDLPVDFGREHGEGVDEADLRRLMDELAAVKTDLAAREAELADARLKASSANTQASRQRLEAELARAQEDWQEESALALAAAQKEWKQAEAARLAAAEAKWRAHAESAIETARASSKAVRDHGDAIELRRLRDELMAMQTLLADRDTELAEHKAAAKPKPTPRAEIEAALTAARKDWQAAETTRLAAAEARWQELTNRAVASAKAQAQSGYDKGDADLRRLTDELAAAKASLTHRDKDLAEVQAKLRQMQQTAERESERFTVSETQWKEKSAAAVTTARAQAEAERDTALAESRKRAAAALDVALAEAQTNWKAQEAERLAAAHAHWQDQSAKALSDARNQSQSSRAAADAEQAQLRGEVSALKALLAERDTALTDAREATERARSEARTHLANAEKTWRAEEATRVSAVEKSLGEKSGSALSDEKSARKSAEAQLRALREQAATLETTLGDRERELSQAIARINATQTEIESLRENEDIQVRRVRGEVTTLQAALAERDEELAQARLFAERSYERWQKQAEAERVKAQKAWKADEAARLAAARAQWQEDARKHLEETLAVERRAISAAPATTPVSPPQDAIAPMPTSPSVSEHRALPEFAAPPLTPSGPPRAAHLSSARDAADEALDRLAKDAYQLLAIPQPENIIRPTDTHIVKGNIVERRRNAPKKNQNLVSTAAIAAGLAAMAALALIFLWPMVFGAPTPQPVAAAPIEMAKPEPVALPTAQVLRNVNLRKAPSTSSAILTLLKRGTTVAIAERSGSWVRIAPAIEGESALSSGWVVSTALQMTDSAQPAAPAQPIAAAPKPAPIPLPEPEKAATPALEPQESPAPQAETPPSTAEPAPEPASEP